MATNQGSLTFPPSLNGCLDSDDNSKVDPEKIGFSSSRLERLDKQFNTDVADGRIPGAVVLIARHGKVGYFKAFGYSDYTRRIPMQRDSLFWLASMTKPVTSVAAMMLVEEAKLHLNDPITDYFPEFTSLKVGNEYMNEAGHRQLDSTDTDRTMTVQDLLRHTSGFTYGQPGGSLVQQAYERANAYDFTQTNEVMVSKLARLPLAYEPGTVFEYGMSTDVLGRLVEVVSGDTLDRFVQKRITDRLDLKDTQFVLSDEDIVRIANPKEPCKVKSPPIRPKPKWISGGGGLWSTAQDYARFAQMLLNGGELGGVRLLSPHTVRLMTANHLPADVSYGTSTTDLGVSAPTASMGQGFGLGVVVRTQQGRNPLPGSVGDFYWPGISGTSFWVDPKEDIVVVLMLRAPAERTRYRSVIRELVYQALLN